MKTILSLLVIVTILFTACSNGKNGKSENGDSTSTAQLSENQILSVSGFDTLAKNFVDKQIQVKGIVDHVCREGGKKLFMVDDNASLHVESDVRFSDSLSGSEVTVTGIVREFRVDEAYCLKMEEDNIKNHKNKELSNDELNQKKENIKYYRDSMKTAGVDHLSFFSLKYVSHTVNKENGEVAK